MQTILIANPKGGSGKTTLATNVAGWLAGKRQLAAPRQQPAGQEVEADPAGVLRHPAGADAVGNRAPQQFVGDLLRDRLVAIALGDRRDVAPDEAFPAVEGQPLLFRRLEVHRPYSPRNTASRLSKNARMPSS